MSKFVVESQEQQLEPYKRLVAFIAFIVVVLAILAFRADAQEEPTVDVSRVATNSLDHGWLEKKLSLPHPVLVERKHSNCRVTFKPVGN